MKFIATTAALVTLWLPVLFSTGPFAWAGPSHAPVEMLSEKDALLATDSEGQVVLEKNASVRSIPASTLKILTALAAFHYLEASYRFQTAFYLSSKQDMKIKGYGDPLLISEVWQDIAKALASRVQACHDLVVDDSYFARDIQIPGVGDSTNPYDAPVGALCANFNTVFFDTDTSGCIVSAEPQTPMTPLALSHIRRMGLKRGRYTFTHKGNDIARYAGEVLSYFLRTNDLACEGQVRPGAVGPKDQLIYTYRSAFSLDEAVRRMLKYSNNFMANQITVAVGAHESGPPGTLRKGVQALLRFSKQVLHLQDVEIVEGSGISRGNRLSARDMLVVLKAFAAHRHLLTREGNVLYKSGTLTGITARAGYVERPDGRPAYYFVLFLKGTPDIKAIMNAVVKELNSRNVRN